MISIHAPSEARGAPRDFNPRPKRSQRSTARFQSTLPVRGATTLTMVGGGDNHISIHAPRAGSDAEPARLTKNWEISIHAPRAGSDKPNKAVYS